MEKPHPAALAEPGITALLEVEFSAFQPSTTTAGRPGTAGSFRFWLALWPPDTRGKLAAAWAAVSVAERYSYPSRCTATPNLCSTGRTR
jgi:hypothetical protein